MIDSIAASYHACMKLSGVDLNLLVSLDALLAERNVTRAAARLGLSQPGMSSALGRLRKLFNDPLLVREGSALIPTPRAESLVQPVRAALALIDGALHERIVFDPENDECTVRVSCSDYSVMLLIAPLVRRLAAEAPGVRIQVQPRSADPARLLRDDDTDLVIEPEGVVASSSLPSQSLFTDRWLCCVWQGNNVVGDEMTVREFFDLGHVVYSMGADAPIALSDAHLAQQSTPRRIEFTVESFLLTPLILQGTDFMSLVLARAVPLLKRTAAIRLIEPPLPIPTLHQKMWWSARRTNDPAQAWVRGRIAEVAEALVRAGEERAGQGPGRGGRSSL